jgi:hypothetical protein
MGFMVVSLFRGLEIPRPDPAMFTTFDYMGFTVTNVMIIFSVSPHHEGV